LTDLRLTFKVLFIIGALVLLLGFILVWIPESGISELKEQLNQATPNIDTAGLEQSLLSESLSLATFYQPISNILKFVGGMVIAYSVLITAFNIVLENRNNKTLISKIPNFMHKKPYLKTAKLEPFAVENNIEQF
jgi:hypothetical protein